MTKEEEKQLLKSLMLVVDIVLDSGFVTYKKMFSEEFSGVRFYIDVNKWWGGFGEKTVDRAYMSLGFKGLSISFYENKISQIEIDEKVEMWGIDLFKWVGEVSQEVSEGIAQKVEDKQQEIDEARATGN